ncbi:hypothetical protein CFP56_042035 [Quercus suber]|uniref:Uncharacterized protein n=1 Tax=Quercus suber TaxID=58331 RepID=A0AAW0IUA7_QUESU
MLSHSFFAITNNSEGTDKENFMDLQDTSTDPWCRKVAKGIIYIGNPIFHALEKGLKSKRIRTKDVKRTTILLLHQFASKEG